MKTNRSMKFCRIAVLILLAAAASAQTFRGGLTGAVTDPSGAALPDATVKIENPATGLIRTTATTSNGDYNFPDLAVGFYSAADALLLQLKLKGGDPQGEPWFWAKDSGVANPLAGATVAYVLVGNGGTDAATFNLAGLRD